MMSVLDKLTLVDTKHAEFEQKLDARAQKALDRYAEDEAKTEKIFDRRDSVLDAREKTLDELDQPLHRLRNPGTSGGTAGGGAVTSQVDIVNQAAQQMGARSQCTSIKPSDGSPLGNA